MAKQEEEKRGTIYPAGEMILRVAVGQATDPGSGVEYEMTTAVDMSPLIKSSKTGKTFRLIWKEIINMAIEAGIDK
jgi:hypothetical protein